MKLFEKMKYIDTSFLRFEIRNAKLFTIDRLIS